MKLAQNSNEQTRRKPAFELFVNIITPEDLMILKQGNADLSIETCSL